MKVVSNKNAQISEESPVKTPIQTINSVKKKTSIKQIFVNAKRIISFG